MRQKFTLYWHSMLCLLMPSLVTAANVTSFYPDLEAAAWTLDDSVFECRLEQRIPGLGRAVFSREAGAALTFYLDAVDSPLAAGRALLSAQPPQWRTELGVRDIAYVDVVSDARPVTLDSGTSQRMIMELGRGMVPTLMRQAWYSPEESIHVGLSPVKFSAAYEQYKQCLEGLLPVNFAQIERSTVFWASNQRELSDAQMQQLSDIVAYLKADPEVYAVDINGFTDSAGRARENLELSRIRAYQVHNYLVSQGVPEDMLNTRYFGATPEFRIIRQERNAADRDRNRRVTLQLHRKDR